MRRETGRTEQTFDLVRSLGVARVQDLKARGIHPEHLRRLCRQERVIRSGRGLYVTADGANLTRNHRLAEACKWVPHGIICLYSALAFHDIGTQSPSEIWMAIDPRAAKPRIGYPTLRIVRFSGDALREGIEVHEIEGVPVKVTNPARTVVDCFKYRNKYGLDVALEALRESLRERRCTVDEIWGYAKMRHVAGVMELYLEAI